METDTDFVKADDATVLTPRLPVFVLTLSNVAISTNKMKLQFLLLGLEASFAFKSVHAASHSGATPCLPIPANAPKTWVHPGVFVSGPQLDYIAKKIKARKDPWKEALDSMLDTSLMSPTRTAEPYETVECGPTSTPNIGCYQEREDSMAA